AYDRWPRSWFPAGNGEAAEFLRHLSFMFGQPYAIDRLHPELQGPEVAGYFGPMHLGIYLHISQMVRRGHADRLDAPDVIDRPGLPRASIPERPVGDLDPRFFTDKRVTLLAATENCVWHRDSMDLMYEWLRASAPAGHQTAYRKHVFSGYGLQELMWGVEA